jgi:hypothetical protein
MARCPAGHESQASDYCDTCGLVIGGGETSPAGSAAPLATAVASPPPSAASSGGVVAGAAASAGGAGCPVCQAERNGRFCEECGYDFDLAEAMPQVTMTPGVTPASSSTVPGQSAGTPTSQQAVEASPGQQPGNGLDLEAELARAEAEAARGEAGAGSGIGAAAAASVATGTEAAAGIAATGSTSPASASAGTDPFLTPATAPEAVVAAETEATASGVGALSTLSGGSGGGSGAGTIGLSTAELTLVVNADADYYAAQVERGDIIESEFPFPKYPHERAFSFTDGPVRIGRASASRGISPEIDLTGPPLDPAVSHLHAQLLRHEEGWVVVDLGSANGTRLNDAEEPLEAETEIPVKQGDRIHLGVWTTITVQ